MREPLLRDAIDPSLAEFAAQLFKGRNGIVGFSLTQQGIGFLEPFLAHGKGPGTDLHRLRNGHGFGHFGEHGRIRIGQDAERGGRTFAKKPRAHVGLMIHGIAAVASAEGIDVSDGDVIRSFGFDKNFALGRNDHRTTAALRDDQINEIFDGSRADGSATDVVVADGRAAQRRIKDNVRSAERQTSGGFRKHHVITDQHSHAAEVASFEDGKAVAAFPVQFVNGHVHFVITADFPAVATEEERGVMDRAVRLDRIVAAHQIHPVRRRDASQTIKHALHRVGQHLIQRRLVGRFPGAEAQGVLRERERVALRVSGLVHDLLQVAQGTVHLRQHFGRVHEPEINQSRARLRRADAHHGLPAW